ncbi:MAG: transcriptional regulator [Pseudopedobacter saltans]|uniref:Transcriptional regulator n=1 Tax=Pseudopedobacter saltans TaxID=151895 RepID=A0A2W5F6F7_9SPHI|nr:MAG: transcriptional regulator [Pseudopedobacter saltans]
MINSRFAMQVHIVSLLALNKDGITSDFIASSIGCNPVLVRKELVLLKNHGMVATQEGKNGGVRLVKQAKDIHLDELYKIVYGDMEMFPSNKNEPNPMCVIGRNISAMMKYINKEAELSMLSKLQETTIEFLIKNIT